MTTVRQTVTTVQQSSGHGAAPGLDNSLDALLEDLQSSVARGGVSGGGSGGGGAPAVNGVSAYRREVTRTLERSGDAAPPPPPQVMHLAPANPTTVVAERSASPLLASMGGVAPGEQRSVSYKTYQYQTYHTSMGGDARSATLPASPAAAALTSSTVSSATSMGGVGGPNDSTSDARLQQNLHELDSLLVDLRHAQRAGFDPPPPAPHAHAHAPNAVYANTPLGSTTTTRTEVVTTSGGIDPGLLEPLDHSTPAPPARQPLASTPTQQQLSRAVEYKTYRTERQHQHQHYTDGGYGAPAAAPAPAPPPPDSPRLQPKRTSSAQRELVYGSEHVSRQRTRSPSPGGPQRREYVEARERYREKSPSHQRLQREVFYETNTTTSSSTGGGGGTPRSHRYREPSPPPPPQQHQVQPLRRGPSPGPPQPPGADYPTGGTRTVTTVRTYNYSTGGSGGGPSPSPAGG